MGLDLLSIDVWIGPEVIGSDITFPAAPFVIDKRCSPSIPSTPLSMPPPRSRSPKRRFRGARSAQRSGGRYRSPITRCRPCGEVKALRALLDRHDKLAAENRCLLDEIQLLKDETAGATKSLVENLKNDLAAKNADITGLKKELNEARATIDGLSKELTDAISARALTEEQTRLRFRLLAQQFEQSICRQQARAPQSSTEPELQPPPPQQPPQQPPPQQSGLTADAEQPSSAGPQIPCVNDLAETDSYDSSSSSGSDAENPHLPAASEL